MKGRELSICCDASIRKFNNGRTFGCAGAICINTNEESYVIINDTTNNRSELMAIYEAILMAHRKVKNNPDEYDSVTIYSDSKNSVFGLKIWMDDWLKHVDSNGVLYKKDKYPVLNQDLYLMILSYLMANNFKINLRHQKGHINYLKSKDMEKAKKVFYTSNGYNLSDEDLCTISMYNSLVDERSRARLMNVNETSYNQDQSSVDMIRYVLNDDYKKYVL